MPTTPTLGPLEQFVLELVWKHPYSSGRFLHEIATQQHDYAYTTVMTVLNRLVAKGVIRRQKENKMYVYASTHSQPQFIRSAVRTTIRSLVQRFGDEAIAAFIAETDQLSHADRQHLIASLKKISQKSKSQKSNTKLHHKS